MTELLVDSEQTMLELGERLAQVFHEGDLVVFEGELGAGKTTLIRGILHVLGWKDSVRSPTFNLFSVYETVPRVLHADFYRVSDARGTGIEDYLDSYLCLVEWPNALVNLADLDTAKRIAIAFEGDARRVRLSNISL